MRKLAYYLTIGALAAVLSGCLGGEGPDTGRTGANLVVTEVEELPVGLDTCSVYFAQDAAWEAPDALLVVQGKSATVVFVQDDLPLCQAPLEAALAALPELDIGGLKLTNQPGTGSVSNIVQDSNPLPAQPGGNGQLSVKNPAGDSNPLPATPGANGTVSSRGGADDSNPLPARPGGSATASMDLLAGDSNPLPAHESSRTVDLSDLDDLKD